MAKSTVNGLIVEGWYSLELLRQVLGSEIIAHLGASFRHANEQLKGITLLFQLLFLGKYTTAIKDAPESLDLWENRDWRKII